MRFTYAVLGFSLAWHLHWAFRLMRVWEGEPKKKNRLTVTSAAISRVWVFFAPYFVLSCVLAVNFSIQWRNFPRTDRHLVWASDCWLCVCVARHVAPAFSSSLHFIDNQAMKWKREQFFFAIPRTDLGPFFPVWHTCASWKCWIHV